MKQLTFDLSRDQSLAEFFASLEQCKNKNYLTHALHPYPAKFIPQIPRVLIEQLAPKDGIVWDPMCGSGTTLVEAALNGRNAIGTDINPVAVLVSTAKTSPLDANDYADLASLQAQLTQAAALIRNDLPAFETRVRRDHFPDFQNRSHWFHDVVTRELTYIRDSIYGLESKKAKVLALCTFSAIIVVVSNQESETRWCAKPMDVQPGACIERFAAKLGVAIDRVRAFSAATKSRVEVTLADARMAPVLSGSVDVVITSPPYANAHDYYLYNKLRLFWLGHEVAPVQSAEIGSRNRHSDRKEEIDVYLSEMREVFGEIARALRRGGRAAIVVADAIIRSQFYHMDRLFHELAQSQELSPVECYRFSHKRFNSSFQAGFGTRQQKMTHVLVYRRL
jgi:DNA modification methylase